MELPHDRGEHEPRKNKARKKKIETLLPAVQLKNIVKRFPGVLAVDHINLEIARGEIHALLGQNGAGKTTLMNILYGLSQPDSGDLYINGKHVHIGSPLDAISHGIGMIHQHFMLIPVFTVAENIALGQSPMQKPLMDIEGVRKKILELEKATGLHVNPDARVDQLCVGDQQRAEIIKAIYWGANILIMDEPTSVLTPEEVDELFVFLRRFADAGNTVIFITHKMREVKAISDRVTVLRNGKVVDTVETKNEDRDSLAKRMVDRLEFLSFERQPVKTGDVLLEFKDVQTPGEYCAPKLCGVSFQVCAGEIFGIAGVDGNGQDEVAHTIMGLDQITGGEIRIKGNSIHNKSTREIIQMGVSAIPAQRQLEGLVNTFSVSECLMLKEWRALPFSKYSLLNSRAIRQNAEEIIREYDIRTTGPDAKIGNMSGGNQQKVVLARELSRNPDILIACHPTIGLDIGATEYVWQQLLARRSQGVAIVLISTELDEILALCDRFVVFYEGQIMGEVMAKQAKVKEVSMMMTGIRQEEIRFEEKSKKKVNAARKPKLAELGVAE